jgi:predicted dehydrogenase
MKNKKIRYAVVGLGHIAQVAVLPAFKHAKSNSELVALVSGDQKKARELSRKYKIEHLYTYEDYDECLKSGLIDAVYIALPNSMHREYAIRACAQGIHVLCEKPLAAGVDDARAIAEAVEDSGVKFMTAYRLHFDKANLEAASVVRSGKIGEPRAFNSTFSFRVKEGNIRTDKDLGGGTLWDIGIYCINAARYIFREEPTEVFAYSSSGFDERFSDTDEMTSAVMRFRDGKLASFTTSFSASPVAFFEVLGTSGILCLDDAYEYATPTTMEIVTPEGKVKTKKFTKRDQFAPEILYFSKCLLNNTVPEPGVIEGLIDVQIVEALYESASTGRPVKLKLAQKEDRPSRRLEHQISAVKEPEIIHAKDPSKD